MNFDRAFAAVVGHEGGYVNDPRVTAIKDALEAALKLAAVEFVAEPLYGQNIRQYGCSVPSCRRPAYAKGMCNAHYMRHRSGRPMDAPLVNRRRTPTCIDCGEPTNSRGGWGRCPRHYKSRRRSVIKSVLIDAFGSTCGSCGGVFPARVFDFHHEGSKTYDPSTLLANGSPSVIAEELAKCSLLCANCHRMEHDDGL